MAVRPLIGFLQATEIGRRERVSERSREWEIRFDKEEEEGVDDPAKY